MPDDRHPDAPWSQSLEPDQYRPVDLRIDRRDGLCVKWADGHTSHYSLAYLRKHCPCAACRTEPAGSPPAQSSPGAIPLAVLPANISKAAEFADAELVGNYGLRITWADGHSTGIYEFHYLRAISPDS